MWSLKMKLLRGVITRQTSRQKTVPFPALWTPSLCQTCNYFTCKHFTFPVLQMTLFSVVVKWEVTAYMQEKQKCDELQASVIDAEQCGGNCSPLLFHINYACTSLKIAAEGVRIFLANESCPKFLQYIHWLKCPPFAPPLFLDHL